MEQQLLDVALPEGCAGRMKKINIQPSLLHIPKYPSITPMCEFVGNIMGDFGIFSSGIKRLPQKYLVARPDVRSGKKKLFSTRRKWWKAKKTTYTYTASRKFQGAKSNRKA